MLKTIGKYEILRLLGKGSMGEVYLGLDPILGREVAIKTIQSGSSFDADGEVRFTREARAMAALNHPHVITIFDFGTVDDLRFLAMEYLEGHDLATLIQGQAHPKRQLLEALAQACEGLGYAHSRGIVHRDVKPGNILVTTRGKRLLAKLLDFGVASVDRSSLTEQGVWMGTVSYMAPEYLDTGKASHSADLFAVGVIIYEILSGGSKPFPGESTTAILNAILRKPAEPIPTGDLKGIPPAVLAVMEQALAKDPDQRFATAEDLATALRAALASPVQAAPEVSRPQIRPQIVVGRGPGANCLSLRVAARQAKPGAVVLVLPGLYKEAVVLDKAITFRGEGSAAEIVLEAPEGACLTVNATGCAFHGLTLQTKGDGPAVDLRTGQTSLAAVALQSLRVAGGASANLKGCAVLDASRQAALLLETGATLSAAETTISNPMGLGLRLQPGATVTGEELDFTDTQAGAVELGPGSSAQFTRCRMLGSRFAGVLAMEGAKAQLQDCQFSGHDGAGLHIMAGAQVQLAACRIVDNPGLGVAVVDGGQATLEDCQLSGNGQPGLLLHRGGKARLSRCQVVDGQSLGIACHRDSGLALAQTVLRGNALGGILLGPGAGQPELAEDNTLEDTVLR